MIFIDAVPMVALLDVLDARHDDAKTTAETLKPEKFVTIWPCFTEAMYLLGRTAKWAGQERLWALLDDGKVSIHVAMLHEPNRMQALMRKYRDNPMDLADASLVSAAESIEENRIFTFDGDFRRYRLADGSAFDVVP